MVFQIALAAFIAYIVVLSLWPRSSRIVELENLVGYKASSALKQNYIPDMPDGPHLYFDQIDIDKWLEKSGLFVEGPMDLSSIDSELINGTRLYLSQQPIFRTENTVSFSLFERPDMSIHYMIRNPNDSEGFHPVYREMYYLSMFRGHGVSPAPIGVSRRLAPFKPTIKTSFANPITDSSAVIGFVLMENHDHTLVQYFRDYTRDFNTMSYGFRNSILLGVELLEILNTVHSRQIVHGSVSMSSIVLMESDRGPIRLINWRRAYRVTTGHTSPPRGANPIRSPQTPWEIEGFRPSFRDDVFRVFMIISTLINGMKSTQMLSYDQIKKGEIFCPIGCYVHLRATSLYNQLHSILDRYVVRHATNDIDRHIDIIGIVDELQNILRSKYL